MTLVTSVARPTAVAEISLRSTQWSLITAINIALMMEAVNTSETSVYFEITRRHIPRKLTYSYSPPFFMISYT
jgi:hypothetical protein